MKLDFAWGNGEIGQRLCKALGLNDKYVKSISFHVETDCIVEITVTHLATRDEAFRLVEAIEESETSV